MTKGVGLEEVEKLWKTLTRGVRPLAFKKLIYLKYIILRFRLKENYYKLCKRSKGLEYLSKNPCLDNYCGLALRDLEELNWVKNFLGVSERTAKDYLLCLERLCL